MKSHEVTTEMPTWFLSTLLHAWGGGPTTTNSGSSSASFSGVLQELGRSGGRGPLIENPRLHWGCWGSGVRECVLLLRAVVHLQDGKDGLCRRTCSWLLPWSLRRGYSAGGGPLSVSPASGHLTASPQERAGSSSGPRLWELPAHSVGMEDAAEGGGE